MFSSNVSGIKFLNPPLLTMAPEQTPVPLQSVQGQEQNCHHWSLSNRSNCISYQIFRKLQSAETKYEHVTEATLMAWIASSTESGTGPFGKERESRMLRWHSVSWIQDSVRLYTYKYRCCNCIFTVDRTYTVVYMRHKGR